LKGKMNNAVSRKSEMQGSLEGIINAWFYHTEAFVKQLACISFHF